MLQAQFASANLIDWGGQLLALSAVQDNQDLALNLVVKVRFQSTDSVSAALSVHRSHDCTHSAAGLSERLWEILDLCSD